MPRWNTDASPDAAAQAVRQRFATRMGQSDDAGSLLSLPADEETEEDASGFLPEHMSRGPRLRLRTPWRVAVLLALAGAAIVTWYLWQSATGQPSIEPLSQSESTDGGAKEHTGKESEGAAAPPSDASEVPKATDGAANLLVHVSGAVQRPGVVSLPPGSRVFQAIDAAGGTIAAADVNSLNLAATVTDGAKIHVPVAGEPPMPEAVEGGGSVGSSQQAGSTAGATPAGTLININTASVEELGTLPGVGPVMAQRIVDWRKEHGPFASVDELDAISGIGPKLMESLQDLVTVQGG